MRAIKSFLAIENLRMLVEIDRDVVSKFHLSKPPRNGTSVLIKKGESSYKKDRWGDYNGICRDSGDPSTVWMYGEYADAGNVWGTCVASAKF